MIFRWNMERLLTSRAAVTLLQIWISMLPSIPPQSRIDPPSNPSIPVIPVVELNQLISSWIFFSLALFFLITSHPAVAIADAVPSCLIPRQILIPVIYSTPVCLVRPSTRSWRVTAANVPARLPLCAELTITSLLWHSRILKLCAWR